MADFRRKADEKNGGLKGRQVYDEGALHRVALQPIKQRGQVVTKIEVTSADSLRVMLRRNTLYRTKLFDRALSVRGRGS